MTLIITRESTESDDPGPEIQDRIWLNMVVAGGSQREKGVRALFTRYRSALIRFLLKRGVAPENADDIVQEAFIRMIKGSATFRNESKVSSWLFQIASNLHIDKTRQVQHEQTVGEDEWRHLESTVSPDPLEGLESQTAENLQDCYDRGFSQFEHEFPDRAEVLRYVVSHHWSIRDVAKFLGRTEGATREFLSQCRKKFRAYVEPCQRYLRVE